MENKPSTLTLIKTETGAIFGAYISIELKASKAQLYLPDPKSFLISFCRGDKYPEAFPLKPSWNHDRAIGYHHKHFLNLGATKAGSDLYIGDQCDKPGRCYSNLGNCFYLPHNVKANSEESKSYLAGAHTFRVVEIETYEVKLRAL